MSAQNDLTVLATHEIVSARGAVVVRVSDRGRHVSNDVAVRLVHHAYMCAIVGCGPRLRLPSAHYIDERARCKWLWAAVKTRGMEGVRHVQPEDAVTIAHDLSCNHQDAQHPRPPPLHCLWRLCYRK